MRCRFCDTEIAAKALICFRCGRPTVDARVAPPPARRGPGTALLASVLGLAGAAAIALPGVADGPELWAGWAAAGLTAAGMLGAWLRGRSGRP